MNKSRVFNALILAGTTAVLAACGSGAGSGLGGMFGGNRLFASQSPAEKRVQEQRDMAVSLDEEWAPGQTKRNTVWDLFSARNAGDVGTNVNRYLWNAALDTLNFLPVETVDPFTGVIATGYGTPPGGGRAYRATIYISDPALDARSLKVAMQSRGGGPVSAAVVSQVEDAILTRARQLRTRDSRF